MLRELVCYEWDGEGMRMPCKIRVFVEKFLCFIRVLIYSSRMCFISFCSQLICVL